MRDDEFEGMKERLQFIGQEQFHRTIICPRSRRRVSFAIAGDASDQSTPALLCCTPSFCSRYVGGPGVHKFAQKYGVRVISLDRPGQGGTPLCAMRDRIQISTDNALSVLEHLEISTVSLFCHSAGVIYALEILRKHPEILHQNPRLYMTSPWVPHGVSGQRTLPLIPKALVSTSHITIPALGKMAGFLGTAFAVSSATLRIKAKKEDAFIFPSSFRGPDLSIPYAPQPPYHREHECLLSEVDRAEMQRCAQSEPLQGLSQDFLLCLGQEGIFNADWMAKAILDVRPALEKRDNGEAATAGESPSHVDVEIMWGEDDWMVPKKGRVWLKEQFLSQAPTFQFTSCELKDLGHDDIISCAEVLGAIFESIKLHG